MMITIGITGGVGAGKSTVLDFLEEKYQAYVMKADEIGHLVMEPGQSCYEPVIALFGRQIIKNDKTIVYITHNVDEVKKLEASQALDIGKDNGAETATIVRYDLSENAEKKSYVEFFANRNVGRSPSRSSAEHLDVTAELARVKEKLYGRTPDARTAAETNAAAIEKTTADRSRSAMPPRQGYSY